MVAKLWAVKVGSQKKSRLFEAKATFFGKFNSKSLLFGQPGFNFGPTQIFRACSFVALWSAKTYST